MPEENKRAHRVLCIVGSMDRGGAETFLMKMYRALDNKSYQMDFAVNKEGIYDTEIIGRNGKLYYIPLRTEHPIKCFHTIRRIVKDNNYQCVLKPCNTPISFFDIYAAKLGGAKRLIVRSCNSNAEMSPVKKLLCRILLPLFNRITTVKLAPSTEAGRFTFGAKAIDNHEVFILRNGLNTCEFRYNEESRINKRLELGIRDENEVIVGCIGRLTRQKNHDYLLGVFKEICNRDVDRVHLVLVGEGEQKEHIESVVNDMKLNDRVILLSNRSDIPELLSAMDVLVLTSFYEGMPNVVIEAQASGLPCVISDRITREAGITELVKFLSIDDDMKEWADAIVKAAAQDKSKRHIYASELKNKGYDISSVKDDFLRLVFEDRK